MAAIRHITLADVAARSGVSTATVSRVLSGAPAARPETRDRVLSAVRELDYRPSAVARALKRQTTRTIGLLVTDIENPFYPHVVRAVEDAAHARGYAVLLCNAADDPGRELAYLEILLERRVDGIVVASSRATRRHAALLARAPIPVVLVNSDARGSHLPAIDTANRRGSRLATRHVLDLGHRVIGHITASPANAAAGVRLAGVRDALRAAALDARNLRVVVGDGHVDGGERAALELLRQRGLTAIVCYNDLTAIGTLRAARSLGRDVPGDVSVVGFDDIDLAAWTDPPLTTVRQQVAEMGRWAVERVARELGGGNGSGRPRVVHLAPELVIRGSTAPAPGEPVVE
ncbi:MAG: LacI family DNA-binding transcriptional regulator [Candidatus Limnocylindria bacterium]